MANYADAFGFLFPSIANIAADSRCDVRTTMRQIAELEAAGWIYCARKVLNGKSNVYFMNLEKLGVRVPPDAQRNAVFMRLLKTHGVAMSPIFASEKSSDTDLFSSDNPQPPQVTKATAQVTKEGGSSDIACPPNRYNHQESIRQGTVNGVEPVPPTPAGGRSKITVSDPELQAKYTALWERMRLSLKPDLSVQHPNFRPIRAGKNDWDLCFSAWWLTSILATDGVWTFVTEAADEAATETGIAKYQARLKSRVQLYFGVPEGAGIAFVVRKPQTQTPAA
jgi:hypothetical protein